MRKLLVAAALAALALPAAAADPKPAPEAKVEKLDTKAKVEGATPKKAPATKVHATNQNKKKRPPKHEAQVAPKA